MNQDNLIFETVSNTKDIGINSASLAAAPGLAVAPGLAAGIESANASFGSIPTLANYLINGYWSYAGDTAHHWASSTISYNLGNLNASEQAEAVSALNSWHDVGNVNFVATTGSANITFNHNGSKVAVTNNTHTSAGLMTSATVDISTDWDTPGIGAYRYQTYIHEIGHALGLGHQGPYNQSATYGTNNIYTNDTWQYSVMSYFAQHNYTGGGSGNAQDRYVVTPEMADIYAIQSIYGTNFSTRTDNTTYGYNTNAGATYDFAKVGFAAMTIVDDGGNDTIDASGSGGAQIIDLTPGSWSSIGGYLHNVGIWQGTIIENAIGGPGLDNIMGNSADNRLDGRGGNDFLTGGAGSDTFVFSSGYAADTVTDFTHGTDVLDVRGFSAIKSFTQLMSFASQVGADTVFNFGSGDSLTLKGVVKTTLTAGDVLFNGKLFVGDDLNGDSTADVLWVNGSGVIDWLMKDGVVTGGNVVTATLPSGWSPLRTGDFNNDGTADVLVRDSGGTVVDWIMKNGTVSSSNVLTTVLTSNWHLVGTGDFNADGTSDIAWQDESGTVIDWIMKDAGVIAGNIVTTGLPANWTAIGTGDFNGDKTSDILVRDTSGTVVDWIMQNGKYQQGNVLTTGLPSNWTMVGTGDVNNDGTTDIIWQDNSGTVVNWVMKDGKYQAGNIMTSGLDPAWKVVKVADFNGDGTADVLLKNGSTVVDWIVQNGKVVDSHVVTTSLDGGWFTV